MTEVPFSEILTGWLLLEGSSVSPDSESHAEGPGIIFSS